jgi:Na+-translocating ferredoxin:NAD+ oxidoreductase subunit G
MENSITKTKSTLLRDALALFLITLISGLALSYVFEITKAPIAKQQYEKKQKAYQAVFADASNFTSDEELMNKITETTLTDINAEYKGITIGEVNLASDSNGKALGYIITVTTTNGYKDPITLTVGYSLEGTVTGMEILSINETAGLGMNAAQPAFKNQFVNKSVDQFVRTKIGATADNEINAISGATITSDAVINAVNAGLGFINEYATEIGGGANE